MDLVSLTIIQCTLIYPVDSVIDPTFEKVGPGCSSVTNFYPVDNLNGPINARCNNLSKTNMISAKM